LTGADEAVGGRTADAEQFRGLAHL
jgi:hypothetical protein